MWIYEKKLQYPVRIKNPNPALAKLIISQYGGPHGEIGASLRYLSQRYAMPYPELRAILTDIGTEELAHLEMVGTIVYQLTRDLTPEQIREQGFDTYFIDHTTGVYPVAASGAPFSSTSASCAEPPDTAGTGAGLFFINRLYRIINITAANNEISARNCDILTGPK